MEGVDPAIGIDLGTTYTCVAVLERNHLQTIPNDEGSRLTPSFVAFNKDGKRYVGNAAKNQMTVNPNNTIFATKRLIGRRYSDVSVQSDIKRWPFKVTGSSDDRPRVSVRNKDEEIQFHPEEISAMLLKKSKAISEDFLGREVNNVVITVPAYFNDSQRQATIAAGKIAGLNVLRIIDEPTAAAVAYGLDKVTNRSKEQNVFVFDLGGGTFDVSVLHMEHGRVEVKATSGDAHLGGDDFVERLMDFLVDQFKIKHDWDIVQNVKALCRLRSHCEQAKIILSTQRETDINIECLCDNIDFSTSISQRFFENLNSDLFTKCIEISKNCLIDAKINKNDINTILLVGGSTRIPKIREMLKEFFENKELCQTINPDEAVAHGAAIMAANLSSQGNRFIKELEVIDVTPLSLGVKIIGGVMSVVVPRNTPIPVKKVKIFTTVEDNQTEISVEVYEGERKLIKDNNFIGEFLLKGIASAPKGDHVFNVCFDINANGILNVSAEDIISGTCNQITISNEDGRLTRSEIKKMIEDSQKFKTQDEEYQRRYNARNSLESYANNMSARIRDMKSTSIQEFTIKVVKDAIEDTIIWVHENKLPEESEAEARLKELMKLSNLII